MIGVPYGVDGTVIPVQKYRDLMKMLSIMTDGKHIFCILGIEAQRHIHYAAPVKNGVYDFLQLAEQVTITARNHRKKENGEQEDYEPSRDEYLSGFWKTDHLLPVITVTLYLGRESWDGPLSLREMYREQNDVFLRYAPDYRVNLIAPAHLTDARINEFHTDLRELLLYIKYSSDKEKLTEVVETNPGFRQMDRKTVELLNEVTDSRLKYPEKEMKIDMCVALQEMRKESEEIGKKIGEEAGKKAGKITGIIRACQKLNATEETILECLMEECGMDAETAGKYVENIGSL